MTSAAVLATDGTEIEAMTRPTTIEKLAQAWRAAYGPILAPLGIPLLGPRDLPNVTAQTQAPTVAVSHTKITATVHPDISGHTFSAHPNWPGPEGLVTLAKQQQRERLIDRAVRIAHAYRPDLLACTCPRCVVEIRCEFRRLARDFPNVLHEGG